MQWERYLRLLLRLVTDAAADQTRQEICEIAEVLLREQPPGTLLADVWEEALSLHRVRYESTVLPDKDDT